MVVVADDGTLKRVSRYDSGTAVVIDDSDTDDELMDLGTMKLKKQFDEEFEGNFY